MEVRLDFDLKKKKYIPQVLKIGKALTKMFLPLNADVLFLSMEFQDMGVHESNADTITSAIYSSMF